MMVATFGEAMIRLSPPAFNRLEQAHSLDLNVGGAEWNVAVDLCRLGLESRWVSALPDNALGRIIRNKAREQGVDTGHVRFVEDSRAGIYFVEYGASPRPSKVTYDRKDSALSKVKPGDIDWERVFDGCQWFHTSGIAPALGPGCAELTGQAIKTARRLGLFVSYDLNFRGNLWSVKDARKTTERFIGSVDMCIGNEEDAAKVLGIQAAGSDHTYAKIDGERYLPVAEQMVERYGFSHVATSLRESESVLSNTWSGMLYTGGKAHFSRKYRLELIDRVGGGDAFSAGCIYSLMNKKNPQDAVEFAAAFSAIKHTIPSDTNWSSVDEVMKLINEGGSRIQR
jgi:2-dehydro-3-deoxygluconokinase